MGKLMWIILGLIVIIAAVIGYFSIAFNTIEVNEESPLSIKDSMLEMNAEEKAEFEDAVEKMKDVEIIGEGIMPKDTRVISQGAFKARAHDVSGNALLIQDNDRKILRFEDFETINGPNLHIYLSSDLGAEEGNFIDLGKIKATKGNVNYDIPEGVDTDKFNKVLVWCVPFKVIFSYSELQ